MVHCPSRSAVCPSVWPSGHPILVVAGHDPDLCQHHCFGNLECSFLPIACAFSFLLWARPYSVIHPLPLPISGMAGGGGSSTAPWASCLSIKALHSILVPGFYWFLRAPELLGCTGIPVCMSRWGPKAVSSDPALLLGKSLGGLNPPCSKEFCLESPTEGCKHKLVLKAPADNTCGNLAAKWNSLVVN